MKTPKGRMRKKEECVKETGRGRDGVMWMGRDFLVACSAVVTHVLEAS